MLVLHQLHLLLAPSSLSDDVNLSQRHRQIKRSGVDSMGEVRAILGNIIWGRGLAPQVVSKYSLIIWEATTAKRNYYKTNYIKHVEKLDLNYPEKIRGPGQDLGGLCPLP